MELWNYKFINVYKGQERKVHIWVLFLFLKKRLKNIVHKHDKRALFSFFYIGYLAL